MKSVEIPHNTSIYNHWMYLEANQLPSLLRITVRNPDLTINPDKKIIKLFKN